jgi:hypothetical protein
MEVQNPMRQSHADELIEFLGLEPGLAGGHFCERLFQQGDGRQRAQGESTHW